uniref:Uncharacterized protein n=1 Tax=Triticum urartu TaxID=4572 RepID=A0A8R7UXC5_TRIUA
MPLLRTATTEICTGDTVAASGAGLVGLPGADRLRLRRRRPRLLRPLRARRRRGHILRRGLLGRGRPLLGLGRRRLQGLLLLGGGEPEGGLDPDEPALGGEAPELRGQHLAVVARERLAVPLPDALRDRVRARPRLAVARRHDRLLSSAQKDQPYP